MFDVAEDVFPEARANKAFALSLVCLVSTGLAGTNLETGHREFS
jgi:hypothetical protein